MRKIVQYIRQSLSMKLSLGILLMAMPIFLLSLSILYFQSRNTVKVEAMEHATSVLNTTMQRICRFMNTLETATDINDYTSSHSTATSTAVLSAQNRTYFPNTAATFLSIP